MLVHGPKISINRFQLCGWYSSVEWKLWSSVECVTRNCLVKLWWSGDKGLSSWRLGSSADSKCGSRCVWQSVWLHHVAFVNHVQARAAWRPATCMGFSSSWATFWRGLCVITVSKNIISFIILRVVEAAWIAWGLMESFASVLAVLCFSLSCF